MITVLLDKTSRTATFEFIEADGPQLNEPINLSLNGKNIGNTSNAVFTLTDLTPDNKYTLQVNDVNKVSFRTCSEKAALDIRQFGAVGDGKNNDTSSIQAAIAACPTGGTILFPPGIWLSGPIFLKSDITIYFSSGATLLGQFKRKFYPILPSCIKQSEDDNLFLGSWEGDPDDCYAALITGINVNNVGIVGAGLIDGNAASGSWWQCPKEKRDARRPRIIFLNSCRNILIQGVTVRNSPSWTIHSLFSRNLRFYGLNIENPRSSPNTDGLNPECSENVEIVGTRISVGDDCVAIKSGKSYWGKLLKRPSRNIRIRRCLMEYGQGAVVIGSEMACGVYDVEASYCLFRNTDRGLRIKTRRGRGKNGVIANIYMHHITMENVPDPLVINCFYNPDPDAINHYSQIRYALPVDDRTPTVRDIRLEKINATGALHTACFILGLPEQPIIGLVMRDIHVSFLSMVQPAPPAVANEIPLLAKAGFVMANVTDPLIENVTADGVVGPQFRILEDLNND